MFARLGRGWNLAKQSLHILSLDKELLLFPLLSGISCILVLASFAAPMLLTEGGQAFINEVNTENPMAYVLGFSYYLANYFVIIFFNTALVGCAMKRMAGDNPTIGDGLSIAFKRLPQILAWTVLSALVGFILKLIEQRSEAIGRIVAGLLGMAWAVVSYFAVPVLAAEGLGPIAALKKSAGIMRRTWGESLGAEFGIGLFVFLFMLLACIPGVLGALSGNPTFMMIGIACSVLSIILICLISSALNAIVISALYCYAEGHPPREFDEDSLAGAFASR